MLQKKKTLGKDLNQNKKYYRRPGSWRYLPEIREDRVQLRKKLKDRGPFYSFSIGEFSLYFGSF